MSGNEGVPLKTSRPRALDVLRRVYAELYLHLSEEYSPAELLLAAQTLIDVTDEEYGLKTYQDGVSHPGYFSYDVDSMIRNRPWVLLENESRCDNLDDERLALNSHAKHKLRSLYNPDKYYHRG